MKFIDLSHKISNNMPVFPGDEGVSIIKTRNLETDYYTAYELKSGMHSGTHIDAPMHKIEDNRTVDMLPIDSFMGNGVLLDARNEQIIKYKPKYEEIIKENDIVLIYTGFSDYFYTDTDKYYNEYPYMDAQLADFLVCKKVKMIGVDTPSPDRHPFELHSMFLGKDIFILGNLTNLSALVALDRFEVYAVPLKIEAEGSLVRAWARGE